MALTDNLISYWKLDEASGTRNDSHGSNNLTDHGSTVSGTGKINNGADFESSSSQYLTCASTAGLQTGDVDFTIQWWVNLESISGSQWILGSKGWNAADSEWVLYIDSSGVPHLGIEDSIPSFQHVDWGSALSTSTWYLIHAWHDSVANQLGIVVNAGTPVTTSHSAGVRSGTSDFSVGGSVTTSEFFDGVVDECAFWKRVLSGAERTSLYNGGAGFAYPFSTGTGPLIRGGRLMKPRLLSGGTLIPAC